MDSLSHQQRSFYIFLGLILMGHAIFMISKIDYKFSQATFVPKAEPIKVKLVQDDIKEMAALSKRRQIVQSEDSANTEKKKDAFLSDKDRSFDRQTVARNVDTFSDTALGNSHKTQKAVKAEAKSAKTQAKPDFKNLKLSDIGMAAGEMVPEVSRAPASESLKGIQNGNPHSQGLSATNDYVEEMALGDFTHLNTVEFKFYGFYHRIRQKLEQYWGRSIQEKAASIFKAGRRLPASENLITSLQVTLNGEGEIVAVKILGASGVKELDDAAIESFNQAGPFPNPPKELLVNGKATIDWGFVVKS